MEKFVNYLWSQDATFGYPGGVPTSMANSGQQWDFPNAWPPTTELLVTGLSKAKSECSDAEDIEMDVVRKWMKNSYKTWRDTDGIMFEKYDVTRVRIYVRIVHMFVHSCLRAWCAMLSTQY